MLRPVLLTLGGVVLQLPFRIALVLIAVVGLAVVSGCADDGSGRASGSLAATSQKADRASIDDKAAQRARRAERRAERLRARLAAERRQRRAERRRAAAERREIRAVAARAEREEEAAAAASECDSNYEGACLDPNSYDYDCDGGSGDGPDYTGLVRVVGDDIHDLDADGDGIACDIS
jgi:hypothetical protein